MNWRLFVVGVTFFSCLPRTFVCFVIAPSSDLPAFKIPPNNVEQPNLRHSGEQLPWENHCMKSLSYQVWQKNGLGLHTTSKERFCFADTMQQNSNLCHRLKMRSVFWCQCSKDSIVNEKIPGLKMHACPSHGRCCCHPSKIPFVRLIRFEFPSMLHLMGDGCI